MPSLIAKTVHGHRYWQIVTSRRVNGKPRQVVLAHLGTTDNLLARLSQADQPIKARTFHFGLLAAAWQLAHHLEIVATVDRHVPHHGHGPSVGQYLLLAALNRLTHPSSKAQLARWYDQCALRRWLPLSPQQLTSQRFWDAMHAIDEAAITAIETDLTHTLVERFHVELRCLCFDCTNFDTFIDTDTPASVAQRGHAKSKRTDLRVVGLALMVSTDFQLPLFSQVYPGNQPDSVTFKSVIQKLIERYRTLAGQLEHVTIVFDKGNNSQDNLNELAGGPYRIIGSLVPSQHPELLAIPHEQFESFSDPRLERTRAHRTAHEAFGKSWTVVITRSEQLLRGQLRGIAQYLRKRRRALDELQTKLRRSQQPGAKGKGYTRERLEAHAKKLRSGQYVNEILHVEVSGQDRDLQLSYRTDRRALQRLEQTILGKRILFTDNHDWSTEEIILGYRSQYHVEAAFRQMKNPYFVSWEPMYHWTDQKIRVHALYCIMALILAGLLHRQARLAGIQQSFEAIATELTELREVMNFHAPANRERGGRLRASTTYTEATPLQSQLVKLFDLDALKVKAGRS